MAIAVEGKVREDAEKFFGNWQASLPDVAEIVGPWLCAPLE
jgi:hypothetical protein